MFDERENCMPTAYMPTVLCTVDQVFTFFISALEALKEQQAFWIVDQKSFKEDILQQKPDWGSGLLCSAGDEAVRCSTVHTSKALLYPLICPGSYIHIFWCCMPPYVWRAWGEDTKMSKYVAACRTGSHSRSLLAFFRHMVPHKGISEMCVDLCMHNVCVRVCWSTSACVTVRVNRISSAFLIFLFIIIILCRFICVLQRWNENIDFSYRLATSL